MFNAEEPLAALIKASGRDERSIERLLYDVAWKFRTPNLDMEWRVRRRVEYIQPLSKFLYGRVTIDAQTVGEGQALNGMRISVYDNGINNLSSQTAGPWHNSLFPPLPNRLTLFRGGPNEHEFFNDLPTAAIHDFVHPVTVANVPDVLRVARGGTDFANPYFVMEKLGREPGTVDLFYFDGSETRVRVGIPLSELPRVRNRYERALGIPPFSEFTPLSTQFRASA
jgi:hypothetical protein